MTPAELANQKEIDQDILYYIRAMQSRAPVTAESILGFLVGARRRKVSAKDVQDRIDYLVSAKFLERFKEWEGGEFLRYEITADGRDLLDGAIPPRGWKP